MLVLVLACLIGESVPLPGFSYCCATYVLRGFPMLCASWISTDSGQLVS